MPEERSLILSSIQNIFSIPDLRKRVLYMLGLLAVYRVGAFIPTPGINHVALEQLFQSNAGTIFGFLDVFSGGALRRFSIFALGIMPYITASIILQLATVVVPYLEKLSKEGELGRKKITQYTRYLTVVLTLFQGFMTAVALERSGEQIVTSPGWGFRLLVMITLTTGTAFIMWIGEQITERGIGNGISLIIFAGIVVGLPSAIGFIWTNVVELRTWSPLTAIFLLVFMVLVVAAVVFVERGQRKIPVQYAKRVVGRRMYGGQSTHIPLKVNQAGVIPLIFASSILTFPLTLAQFIPAVSRLQSWIGYGTVGYNILYVGMIIFFTYFYTAVTFNPQEIADNMKKNGGFVPGLRPGRPTAEYMERVLARITLPGAIFLAIIAVMPFVVSLVTRIPQNILNLGGTGMIIMVGVALDTMKQIESHLLLRHYEGFLN